MTYLAGAHAAIVLAAGGSLRLGRPKQLLVRDGETLIHRAVRLATDTTPVKFVSTIATAAAPSTSAAAWSPSTPNATSTTSKSPNRSNVVATNDSCVAKSVASNATASTAVAPAARIAAIVSVRSSGLRAASTTRGRAKFVP